MSLSVRDGEEFAGPNYFDEGFVGDVVSAYDLGLVGAEALFDKYVEEDLVQLAPSALSEWDLAFDKKIKRLNPNSSFISVKDEAPLQQAVRAGLSAAKTLEANNAGLGEDERKVLEQAIKDGTVARDKLFEANLRFIAWFVRETMGFHKNRYVGKGRKLHISRYSAGNLEDYAGAPLDYADRFQAASAGLLKAIEKHNPDKGDLKTIAMYYMEQQLIRAIDETSEDYVTRIPIRSHTRYRKVRRSFRAAGDRGVLPNLDEVVFEAGLSHSMVEEVAGQIAVLGGGLSLEGIESQLADVAEADHDYWKEDADVEVGLAERVRAQNDLDPFLEFEDDATLQTIYDALEELSEKQRETIELRTGLYNDVPQTLEEVGRNFGLTRERIRQIEARSLDKIRGSKYWGRLKSINGNYDSHTGFREGVLALSTDELGRLGLLPSVALDKTPSDKYRIEPQKKIIYQEDWSD